MKTTSAINDALRAVDNLRDKGPRVGAPSERSQKKLAKLIAKGRVEPVLEERPGYQLQVGWRRKGASRHAESWKLNTARPFRQPWAVLQRSRGAELITDERRRPQNVLGYDAARDSNYTNHELGKAAVCYLFAANLLEKGTAPEEVMTLGDDAMFAKMWPEEWDPVHFKPGRDPIRCRVKCGALFWADADRMVRAGITDERLRQCLRGVDAQAEAIDKLLTKQPEVAAS